MKRILPLILALTLLFAASAESVTARISLKGASRGCVNNIELAAEAISGTSVAYGEKFSFNDLVGKRSSSRGYVTAKNGRGAEVTGGGVAQVAAVIDMALKEAGTDVEYLSRKTYGDAYNQDYVRKVSQAILVDYSSGVDYSFKNRDDDVMIAVWTTDSYLYCSVTDLPDEDDGPSFRFDDLDDDLLARATIPLKGGSALKTNVKLAAASVSGTVLAHGEIFSFNDTVGPRTAKNGYKTALNGRGRNVTGGGVAQVASALWLALKQTDALKVTEKSTYGSAYNQSYVKSSNDAILTDYNAGTDFCFKNKGWEDVEIEVFVEDGEIVCEIYEE